MEIPLLVDVIIILGISIPVILVLHRLKLPSIVGFIVSGVLVGPSAFKLIHSQEDVDMLAEIGVILLLFTIGIEFSLSNLIKIRKAVFVAGSVQLLLTTVTFGGFFYLYGYDYLPIAFFIGFLFALSSTAIVFKVLQMQGAMGTPYGQVVVAIMIFQDIAVVPMMLMTPMLAGQSEDINYEILTLLLKVAGVLVSLYICTKYIVPRFLYLIAQTKSKELFIVSVLVICFVIAWLTSLAGLSLALGAFLAGLIISESEYSHEAAGNILPFKEIFTSIFFISIGMLLDVTFFLTNLPTILFFAMLSMLVQTLIGALAALALKLPMRISLLVGFAVCQVGEFSFVLSKTGLDIGLLPIEIYQYFLTIAICTMAFTPLLIIYSEKIVYLLFYKLPIPRKLQRQLMAKRVKLPSFLQSVKNDIKEHIIIVGYGLNGRSLAKGARAAQIPYLVIEMDPIKIKQGVEDSGHIIFGDASNEEVLHAAMVEKANLVVITVTDADISRMVIRCIKHLNKDAFIIARTRRSSEIKSITDSGADVAIADELETNLAIFTQALEHYYIPQFEIYKYASVLREAE